MEHANGTKSKMVPTVHCPSLLLSGKKEPIFKWRDGLKGCPGKLGGKGWKGAAWKDRDGAGDEEMQRENQLWKMQGERRESSALQVKPN